MIVDGLLGTGIKGEVRPYFAHLIERLNQATAPIVAIDTPSGLNTDTGAVAGTAIVADYTVTFIGVKQGLVTGRARAHTGVLSFAGLGVDEVFTKQNTANALLAQSFWLELLKARSRDTHKGRQGSVLVVGGNDGMSGAAYLASCAALKSGAGLAATYVHPESCLAVRVLLPEAMVSGHETDSVLLEQRVQWANALCIGPGLGRDHWGESVYKSAVQLSTKFNKPMVVDADGLYWLNVESEHKDNRVLTPTQEKRQGYWVSQTFRLKAIVFQQLATYSISLVAWLYSKVLEPLFVIVQRPLFAMRVIREWRREGWGCAGGCHRFILGSGLSYF